MPEGGNKAVIKLEDGVERYSDDPQGGAEAHGNGHEAAADHKEEAAAVKPEAEAPKKTVLLQNLLKQKKLQKLNTNY